MSKPPVFRFAPSPNGELHLGHAYSALFTADAAARHGGRLLLRIEDIDPVRSKRAFERQILDDLAWLGLEWEEPVRRQSDHLEDYRAALDKLIKLGVVYPSFASRGEIRNAAAADKRAPRRKDPDGQMLYPATLKARDRELAAGPNPPRGAYAWRLDAGLAAARAAEIAGKVPTFTETGCGPRGERGTLPVDLAQWGDVVIARKDVATSYHLSVVVDDALQGVSHITRGQDLFHASHVHRILQILLALPEPFYHHHGLILDETGRRLSKSAGDKSLKALRGQGLSPADIRAMTGLA